MHKLDLHDRMTFLALLSLLLYSSGLSSQIFQERAIEMGIDHFAEDDKAMGGGVAIFDFNNDGLQDVYFAGGSRPDMLYENLGNTTFRDVTETVGLNIMNAVKTMGVVAGDYDNDGYTDLFVTTDENSRCYLLKNQEGKSFRDISLVAGITDRSWSMTATMGDYDLDGDLDIYVSNYVAFDALPFDQNITEPLVDFFYENNGNGTFTRIANPLTDENKGCTLVSSFTDIDQDGDSDLFVLNDFGDFYIPNKLLLNNYPLKEFDDISEQVGIRSAINSMGLATGDFDEDGDFDYYITNIGNNILYRQTNGTFFNEANTLEVNDGTGTSWGTAFMDVNNDGHLDLYVSRGTLLDLNDDQDNLLYIGYGSQERFENQSETLKTVTPNKARGMAYGDLNNDGFLDVITTNLRIGANNRGKTKIYLNTGDTGQNWIKLDLEGKEANRSAYGTLVKLYVPNRVMTREISGGASYLSSHEPVAHFGLGQHAVIDSLSVFWPGSTNVQTFKNLEANRDYSLVQGEEILTKTMETIFICQGEEVEIQGEMRNEEGVFREIEDNGTGIKNLAITKLIIRDINDTDCFSSVPDDLDDLGDIDIRIYPNPFEDTLQIAAGNSFSNLVKIIISDTSGRAVLSQNINTNSTRGILRISDYGSLQPGLYILTLIDGDKKLTRKVIKR